MGIMDLMEVWETVDLAVVQIELVRRKEDQIVACLRIGEIIVVSQTVMKW